ncbi:MAG: phosphonate metabolism protein/1,5-bisphosphokinase (PRPP-forming) PhnN [Bacteroidota bacterium]
MNSGKLFYVIGPSGAGKDSVMTYAREKIDGQLPVLFAHRYITRPADAGGENHVYLSPNEFLKRKALGLFALDWQSHGNFYGIGTEINTWLAGGATVVVNGSREYLPTATERFPQMWVVLISVSPEVLYQRLVARRRETMEEINCRIERSQQISAISHPRVLHLTNDTILEETGAKFIDLIISVV